ncbi:MAG: efflux RND transporter periplasmic adaptor subunit [Bacteroidales bacterium]|jgi:HlyD family secretion protein|nr:efflux RND transporter periplasmic adaptor subunit [Bacteroidales bacterium]
MKLRKIRLKKWHIVMLIAIAVLIVVLIASGGGSVTAVRLYTIEKQDLVESIPANGKVRPVIEVSITPDVSGEIVELNCREGDNVSKGDVLVKIRQDVYISMVERAEAVLNAARSDYLQQKAQFKQAEINFKRNKILYKENVISAAEYETSQLNFEIAKEQLTAAQYGVSSGRAALKEATENLTKTVICAPMDGTVSMIAVKIGERVVGTSQMAGTEIMRIADLSDMEVVVDVNENDILKLRPGNSAKIDIDACPGQLFEGIVTQIANSATNLYSNFEQVTTFEVRIGIQCDTTAGVTFPTTLPFRPGMSARVTIVTGQRADIVTVPIEAVFIKNGIECVWKVDEKNTVHATPVMSGIQDFSSIEIISGLEPGSRIVAGPYSVISKELEEGMKVRGTIY